MQKPQTLSPPATTDTAPAPSIGKLLAKSDAISQKAKLLCENLVAEFREHTHSEVNRETSIKTCEIVHQITMATVEICHDIATPLHGFSDVANELKTTLAIVGAINIAIRQNEGRDCSHAHYLRQLSESYVRLNLAISWATLPFFGDVNPNSVQPDTHDKTEQYIASNERLFGIEFLKALREDANRGIEDARHQLLVATILAAIPAMEPQPGETKEAFAKCKATFERIVGYLSKMAVGVDIEQTIAIIDSGNSIKERLLALSQLLLFSNIMDAPNRVIARLLKCSHTQVGTAKKELKPEMAKAKMKDEDVTDDTQNVNDKKYDTNSDDDNEAVNADADHLTIVGTDSIRKGQRAGKLSRKLSPIDRAAELADAKHDREVNELIAKHGG